MNYLYQKILNTEKESAVPVKKIMDLLFFLKDGKPQSNFFLLQKMGVSKNSLNLVKQMLSFLLLPSSNSTQIRPQFIGDVSNLFPNYYKTEQNFTQIFKDPLMTKTLETFKKLTQKRILPDRRYDQFNATNETSVKRAIMLDHLEDIRDKKILFLGDDDYTCVAVSLMPRPAQQISVVDIDQRILEKINRINKFLKNKISVKQYDATKQINPFLKTKYDVVFTDPPYTQNGITLFLSRAIEALDPSNPVGKIYLCFGVSDRSKEKALIIQDIINQSGLLIRQVFDRFNRYDKAESIGSSSNLYILEKTKYSKSLVSGNYDKKIYTND